MLKKRIVTLKYRLQLHFVNKYLLNYDLGKRSCPGKDWHLRIALALCLEERGVGEFCTIVFFDVAVLNRLRKQHYIVKYVSLLELWRINCNCSLITKERITCTSDSEVDVCCFICLHYFLGSISVGA